MTTIELTTEEMLFASKIGYYRTIENEQRPDIADYDQKRFRLTSLQANRLGVMCEMAAGKALGLDMLHTTMDQWVSWIPSEHYGMYPKPDILQRYEVRRCEKMSNPIPIRLKDVEHEAIVLQIHVEYIKNDDEIIVPSRATIVGWCDAKEEWATADKPAWSRSNKSRVVTEKRPFSELIVNV